jgi:predicted esterase
MVAFVVCCALAANTQRVPVLDLRNQSLLDRIEKAGKDPDISGDSAFSILSSWNEYPPIKETAKYYLFIHHDPHFGDIPLKVYIPANYTPGTASPAILLLHGAVVRSSFKDAYTDTLSDKALFFDFFRKENYVIIRPFADGEGPAAAGNIYFDWVINHFNKTQHRDDRSNPTFTALNGIIITLKKMLNLDDNRIFALGFSDGADGVFGLDVYQPTAFAAFVAFNSMLINSFAYDIYLRNTLNRPMRIIHSDKDEIRPVEQTRAIVKILDSINSPIVYKEYKGFQHFDNHLQKDLPATYAWMKKTERDPFPKKIYWEMSDTSNNRCDWLKITAIDTSLRKARWHTELNTGLYSAIADIFLNDPYYRLNKSGAVNATYKKNKFTITTSRIRQVEIFISPAMINLDEPVTVTVNGKTYFEGKIGVSKRFLLDQFSQDFDKKAIWINSIRLGIE